MILHDFALASILSVLNKAHEQLVRSGFAERGFGWFVQGWGARSPLLFPLHLISKLPGAVGKWAWILLKPDPQRSGLWLTEMLKPTNRYLFLFPVCKSPVPSKYLVRIVMLVYMLSCLFPMLSSVPVAALAESSKSPFVLPELPWRGQLN